MRLLFYSTLFFCEVSRGSAPGTGASCPQIEDCSRAQARLACCRRIQPLLRLRHSWHYRLRSPRTGPGDDNVTSTRPLHITHMQSAPLCLQSQLGTLTRPSGFLVAIVAANVPVVLGLSHPEPRNGSFFSKGNSQTKCAVYWKTKRLVLVNRGRQQRQVRTRRYRPAHTVGPVGTSHSRSPGNNSPHLHKPPMPILVSVGRFHEAPHAMETRERPHSVPTQNEDAEMKSTRATQWSHVVRRHITTSRCNNVNLELSSGKYGSPTCAVPHAAKYQALTTLGSAGVTKIRSCFDRDDRC